MRNGGLIQIIQGGQYGSEAKGAIAAYLALSTPINYAVRTGATNAGHTVVHNGVAYKMQQLPVGWVNRNATLVIGAGAYIDIEILNAEIAQLQAAGMDVADRLFIDYRATIHARDTREVSAESGRHHRIGATGKGCSEAIIRKLRNRGLNAMLISDHEQGDRYNLVDTAKMLNDAYDYGSIIQLEGTQGTLLDLHLGHYPYVTHKQTGPAQWMMEAGLSPALRTEIVMVVRTFPIRVAGNSGPLPRETSWPILARQINKLLANDNLQPLVNERALTAFEEAVREASKRYEMPLGSDGNDMHQWHTKDRVAYQEALSEVHKDALQMLLPDTIEELSKLFEMTTVTRKLRRIGAISFSDLRTAAMQVRPHKLALTFMNYVAPNMWHSEVPELSKAEQDYVAVVAGTTGTPITLINRGPNREHIIEV